MLYATAIKFSGQLISANECNYKSFSDLCLICPHCKGSVYLVGEHLRSTSIRQLKSGKKTVVKEAKVNPYFAHHTDVESGCAEKNMGISDSEIIHRVTVARLQRARLFKASFWELFCSNQYLVDTVTKMGLGMFSSCVTQCLENNSIKFSSEISKTSILISMTQKNSSIERTIKDKLLSGKELPSSVILDSILDFLDPKIRDSADAFFKRTFALEALSFLYAPQNKKILITCLTGLLMSLYSNSLAKSSSNYMQCFPDSIISNESIEAISIVAETHANEFLLQDNRIPIQGIEKILSISTLSITLIVALISINPEFLINKNNNNLSHA